MVTIIGTGMHPYNFEHLDINFNVYEMIFCDKNFTTKRENIISGDFKTVKASLLKNTDKNILYIATGSPTFFSGAILIINELKKQNISFKIIDNTSSLNYMLAHLGVSLVATGIVTLHAKTYLDLTNFFTKKYTFLICDENTPSLLHNSLHYINPEDYTITLGEHFGYDDERFIVTNVKEMLDNPPKMPYSLLFEKKFTTKSFISAEEEIEHENGMITKSYKRHISLQNLELLPNQLLWDIGAGSGSISIDAYKRYKVRTTLFEKNEKRCEMIKNNLRNHRVVETKLHIGHASKFYKNEEDYPDRIFVGGGGFDVISELDYLYKCLNDGGIMVANFVTLTHLTTAINILKEADIQFDIKSISLTTYKHKLLIPEPERVMHQLIVKKELHD